MKQKYPCHFGVPFFLAILLYLPAIVFSQSKGSYPQNYFRWPLDIQPAIVANMGELRNNHWHMGLDIRTNQKENLKVVAAASGYISKIRIEKFGFGRSIVITHPNGFSTLYAHLNNFFPALEEYVTQQQYKQESWAIELDFPKEKFPVTKGQFIAYSGNTGGSQGPHVHFEIRDTKTGTCMNPMLFGMPFQDNVAPSLLKLALYDRSGSIYEQATRFFPLKKTKDDYVVLNMPLIKTGTNKISFAIQSFDRLAGSKNEDGIFSAQLFVDENAVVGFSFDSISYQTTRYLNAHTDYKYHFNGGPFFQHLSQLPGEHSGVYSQQSGNGVISLADTQIHSVRVEVRDAYKNVCQLIFSVQYDNSLLKPGIFSSTAKKFLPNAVNILEKPGFEIYLPRICLYDTLTSFYNRTTTLSEYALSAIHQVNDPSVPVHGELTVRLKPDKEIPAAWRDKIIIQRSYRNDNNARKAEWNGEWLSARFGDLGSFQAFADVVAPTVDDLGKGDTIDLSAAKRIAFQPDDNFGVKSFRAELDGKWLRFTNDKGRSHIYIFDQRCPYGTHQLTVTVEDLAGNSTIKTWWFKRHPYTPKKKSAAKKGSKTKKTSLKSKSAKKKKK